MNVNPFSYLIEKLKSKVDTAGTGLIKSGTTISTFVPRVAQSANTKPGQNSFDINEYNASSADLPDSNFYHILTAEGPDDAYITQIALGMTANKMFYRRCNANTWGPWEELAFKSDIVYPTQRTKLATIEVGESTKDVTPSHNGYLMANINAGASAQDVTIGVRNSAYFGTASTTNIEIWHGGYGPIMPCKAGVTYTYFDVHGHVSSIDIYECY